MKSNGKLPHSTTAVLEMPAIQVQVPDNSVQAPDSSMQAPDNSMQVSDNSMQASDSSMQASDSSMQASDSSMQVSDSSMQVSDNSPRPSKHSLNTYRSDDATERRLMAAHLVFETVLGDSRLTDELSPYGYARARILQGQALYQQALALIKQHRGSLGDKLAAADGYEAAQAQAHARYKRHVALARLALRDNRSAAQKLDLSARKRTRAGWVLQADQFYTNALTDQTIIAKLAAYGVTTEQLREAQQQVAAVAASIVAQEHFKHAAKETKQARDAALQALDRWMLDFLAVARIALADQPQRLAQLGLARG